MQVGDIVKFAEPDEYDYEYTIEKIDLSFSGEVRCWAEFSNELCWASPEDLIIVESRQRPLKNHRIGVKGQKKNSLPSFQETLFMYQNL